MRISYRKRGFTLIETAVVILVVSILFFVLGSVIANLPILRTASDDSTALKEALGFAYHAAIRSNQVVYLEVDLEKDSYRAFRYDRKGGKPVEKDLLKRDLSSDFVYVLPKAGSRISSGTVRLPFLPDGTAEDVLFCIGSRPEIKKSIRLSRFGGRVEIRNGEWTEEEEKEEWKENLERI